MKTLYLLVDFFTIIVPLLFSFHPRIRFYKTWKAFFAAAILVATVFIVWDEIFVRLGVWSFNPKYVFGVYLLHLPVEELLFFICIPYSCVFTFYCLTKFYNLAWKPLLEKAFCFILIAALLVNGLCFYGWLYTSWTFISAAIACFVFKFLLRVNWFGNAVTVFAILMVPFLIVNGILTGAVTDEPTVIYNNTENLGIRILTIPFEDVFYGFELILLNIYFYKFFCRSFYGKEREA